MLIRTLLFGSLILMPCRAEITLCEQPDDRGHSVRVEAIDPDSSNNRIDPLETIRIERDAILTPWSEPRDHGRNTVLDQSMSDLSHNMPVIAAVQIERNRTRSVPRRTSESGVVLYAETGFQGREQVFRNDVPLLRNTHLGTRVTSLRVPPDTVVTLYRGKGFRGPAEVFYRSDLDLGDNRIGTTIGSVKIRILRDVRGPAVTLYEHKNFRGRSQSFDKNISDLAGSPLGNDSTSSLVVAPGFVLTVYEHADYGGSSQTFRGEVANLSDTVIGNDRISSLRVRREAPSRPRDNVVLFRHSDFRGARLETRTDIPRMGDTLIGNDELSSIHVPTGWRVILYSDANFRGDYQVLESSVAKMRGLRVGNDSASSIRIEWVGRR